MEQQRSPSSHGERHRIIIGRILGHSNDRLYSSRLFGSKRSNGEPHTHDDNRSRQRMCGRNDNGSRRDKRRHVEYSKRRDNDRVGYRCSHRSNARSGKYYLFDRDVYGYEDDNSQPGTGNNRGNRCMHRVHRHVDGIDKRG